MTISPALHGPIPARVGGRASAPGRERPSPQVPSSTLPREQQPKLSQRTVRRAQKPFKAAADAGFGNDSTDKLMDGLFEAAQSQAMALALPSLDAAVAGSTHGDGLGDGEVGEHYGDGDPSNAIDTSGLVAIEALKSTKERARTQSRETARASRGSAAHSSLLDATTGNEAGAGRDRKRRRSVAAITPRAATSTTSISTDSKRRRGDSTGILDVPTSASGPKPIMSMQTFLKQRAGHVQGNANNRATPRAGATRREKDTGDDNPNASALQTSRTAGRGPLSGKGKRSRAADLNLGLGVGLEVGLRLADEEHSTLTINYRASTGGALRAATAGMPRPSRIDAALRAAQDQALQLGAASAADNGTLGTSATALLASAPRRAVGVSGRGSTAGPRGSASGPELPSSFSSSSSSSSVPATNRGPVRDLSTDRPATGILAAHAQLQARMRRDVTRTTDSRGDAITTTQMLPAALRAAIERSRGGAAAAAAAVLSQNDGSLG